MIDSKKNNNYGTIYIVATPIGNLNDLSPRAQQILAEVNLIAAEDTRHSQALLKHFNIQTPMTSYHEHNEEEKALYLLEKVCQGQNIAIISDAGTPLISDPGYQIVAKAAVAGIKIVPVPGPCAAIAALSAAGLPSAKFLFIGFLAAKTTSRKKELLNYKEYPYTLVCYESTHRIMETLADLKEIMPERKLSIARELTKTFETILHGTVEQLWEILVKDANQQKGEFVLVIAPAEKKIEQEKIELGVEKILAELLTELPLKKAVNLAAKITGERKNKLYDQALEIRHTYDNKP